jgi:hypothetical protein
LAQTDPALYRSLRAQITRFVLLGGDVFSLEALEANRPVLPLRVVLTVSLTFMIRSSAFGDPFPTL